MTRSSDIFPDERPPKEFPDRVSLIKNTKLRVLALGKFAFEERLHHKATGRE
jgi:hypothetical protein